MKKVLPIVCLSFSLLGTKAYADVNVPKEDIQKSVSDNVELPKSTQNSTQAVLNNDDSISGEINSQDTSNQQIVVKDEESNITSESIEDTKKDNVFNDLDSIKNKENNNVNIDENNEKEVNETTSESTKEKSTDISIDPNNTADSKPIDNSTKELNEKLDNNSSSSVKSDDLKNSTKNSDELLNDSSNKMNGEALKTTSSEKKEDSKIDIISDKVEKKQEAKNGSSKLKYQLLINGKWVSFDGSAAEGIINKEKISGIKVFLDNKDVTGDVLYSAHLQSIGWTENKKNGQEIKNNDNKRLEGLSVNLAGEISKIYDIRYRVYSSDFGWLDWAKNGGLSGSSGWSSEIHGLQIELLEKQKNLLEEIKLLLNM